MSIGVQEDYIKKAKDIFKLINEFRRIPKSLAKHLEGLKKHLDKNSNVLSEPGKIQVQMVEGDAVFNEAIDFLYSLPYLKPVIWDDNLSLSAMEHVLDIGPKGLLSYQSSDGTEPEERISRYGNYIDSLGENIDFGPNDAMGVLVSLTLDDGEPDRPHRENLFKTDYQKLGIACGPHKTEYQMCVMDFAFDFVQFGDEGEAESSQNLSITGNSNVISNNTNTNKNNNNNNNSIPSNTQSSKSNNQATLQIQLPNGNKNDTNKMPIKSNSNSNLVEDKRMNLPSSSTYNPNKSPLNNLNDIDMFVDQGLTANFTKNTSSVNPQETFGLINNNNNLNNYPPSSNTLKYPHPSSNTYNPNAVNQSPIVRLSLDDEEFKNQKALLVKENLITSSMNRNNEDEMLINKVKGINLQKKVISKLVEVTTRIVYTYEDGSTKEVIEKQNHVFEQDN